MVADHPEMSKDSIGEVLKSPDEVWDIFKRTNDWSVAGRFVFRYSLKRCGCYDSKQHWARVVVDTEDPSIVTDTNYGPEQYSYYGAGVNTAYFSLKRWNDV